MSMFAIVKTGGKQYKAEPNGLITVEKIEGEVGDSVELGDVLMYCKDTDIKFGSPFLKGAKVTAKIVRQCKGPKINGFTYKPKKNQRKRWGHRQPETHLQIIDVVGGK